MPQTDYNQMTVQEVFNEVLGHFSEDNDKKELEDIEEIYEKMRNGINMKFDLYDYLHGVMKIKEKQGKILYRGKILDMTRFWTELEKRTTAGRKWLKQHQEGIGVRAYE